VRTGLGVDRAAVVAKSSLALRVELGLELHRDGENGRARALPLDGVGLVHRALGRLGICRLALLLLLARGAAPRAPLGSGHSRLGKEGDLLLAQGELRLALGLAADHHAVVGAALLAVLGEGHARSGIILDVLLRVSKLGIALVAGVLLLNLV